MGRYKIEGMKQLQKKIKKLGDVPQRCVTPAARKAMRIPLKKAKKNAPVNLGELRKGMKLVGERSRTKGKKVYQVVFDRAKNNIFQKKNAQGQITGYYPASQEFGFFTKNGRYIPGYHFLEKSLKQSKKDIEKKIIEEMNKNISKALEGR